MKLRTGKRNVFLDHLYLISDTVDAEIEICRGRICSTDTTDEISFRIRCPGKGELCRTVPAGRAVAVLFEMLDSIAATEADTERPRP